MGWWKAVKIDCGEIEFDDLPDWERQRILALIDEGYVEGELRDYATCKDCGELYDEEELNDDSLCPDCAGNDEEE